MHTAKRPGLMRNHQVGSVLSAALCAGAALAANSAQATIVISSQPTQNMTCANGVCAPTAKQAVLNAGDLETLLASGNVTVTTTGSGVEADNINVRSALSWATANTLALTAHRSVAVDAPVSVVGLSGLTFQTNGAKGTFTFGSKGSVGFSNMSSALAINGVAYALAGNIKTLATDIAANPSGAYALASTYDASADGTYTSSPIGTVFTGAFEGLGNTILNLSVNGATLINGGFYEGLFAEVDAQGRLENVDLANATIVASGGFAPLGAGTLVADNRGWIGTSHVSGTIGAILTKRSTEIGGLVGGNSGTIERSSAAASVDGTQGDIGGLVGVSSGTIDASSASGAVSGSNTVGGLVSNNLGTVSSSFATGVVVARGRGPWAGGLVGFNQLSIENSYATGSVRGSHGSSNGANLGGLIGVNSRSTVNYSYSTGAVTGGTGDYIGGLIGLDNSSSGSLTDTDWDTDKSGITNLSQGAGNIPNDPGITGLTTTQFQSGLPKGFDPKIWAEKPNINGGLPYLLANPPPK